MTRTTRWILVTCALLSTAQMGHAQSWCQPTYPLDTPAPATDDRAVCVPGTVWRRGAPIQVVRVASAPTVGTHVSLSRGIALQVDPDDVDEHVLTCTNEGTAVESTMPTADQTRAEFGVFSTTLPIPGYWEGWGITSTTTWTAKAGVYRLDPATPPGDYKITFACLVDDLATAADDPPVLWMIDADVEVDSCGYTFRGFTNDQLIPLTMGPEGPLTGTNCCAGLAQYAKGPAIRNTAPCDGYVPGIVAPDDFALFGCTGTDTDYIRRLCDDEVTCQHGLNGNRIDVITKDDSLKFTWNVQRVGGTPGGTGKFLINPGSEVVAWQAPSEPGLLELCVTITDRGHQAGDDPLVRHLQQWVLVAPHEMSATDRIDPTIYRYGPDLACQGVRTWVNTDNDDLDGTRDDQQANLGALEDDLIHVSLPPTATRVRFNSQYTGSGRVRLHRRTTPTGGYAPLSLNTWYDVTTFANQELCIEGIAASSLLGDIGLRVDIDPNGSLWPCAMPSAILTERVQVTVFGLTKIEFLTANGFGEAKRWSTVTPAALRPSGWADNTRAQHAWYIEPGADPNVDTPDTGSNPATWRNNRRDHLIVKATVQPAVGGITVYYRGLDVDDNSIDTSSWAAAQRNYVDDDTNAGAEKDNVGLMLDRVSGAESLGNFDGRVSQQANGATLLVDSQVTQQNGEVLFYFISTLSAADDFRIACSLDPSQFPAAGAAKVFAPKAEEWAPRDDVSAALAWHANAGNPVPVPADALVSGASVLCSDVLTVRQVYWVEQCKAGAYLTNPANYLVNPGIQAEPETFGIRRCFTSMATTATGALEFKFPPRVQLTMLGLPVNAELGPICDNSLRRCEGVIAGMAVMEANPAGVFNDGALSAGNQTVGIAVSDATFARTAPGAVVNYTHPGGGGQSSILRIAPGTVIPGTGGARGIDISVSNNPPAAWINQQVDVCGKLLTIRQVAPGHIYTTTTVELFPATLSSDDRNAWWQPGPMAVSVSSVQATKGGGAVFVLVNHQLRDFCFRIAPLGAVRAVPFRIALPTLMDIASIQNYELTGSSLAARNLEPSAKCWTALHIELPRVAVDMDLDGDADPTTGMTLARHVALMAGFPALPRPGMTTIATGYEVEHDWQTSIALASILPYGMFQYGLVSNLDMGRARALAHEIQHTIAFFDAITPGAPYAAAGVQIPPHAVPGLMDTDGTGLAGDVDQRMDPVLGSNVQGSLNMIGPGTESGVSPAMIRSSRQTFRYPGVRR